MYPLGVLGCDLVKKRAWSEHGKVDSSSEDEVLKRRGDTTQGARAGKKSNFFRPMHWVLGIDVKIRVLRIKLWFNFSYRHMYSSRQLSSRVE